MASIEREIKIINIDVYKIKKKLKEKNIESKWKYIQDVYTFDLPKIEVLYCNAINKLKESNDKRLLEKLINDIRPCFSINDINTLNAILGCSDIVEYVNKSNDLSLLDNKKIINIMKKANKNYSKWVRMRRTGNETTITIKKIISSNGIYDINSVNELEFNIPSIEFGKEFLSDLGYFFDRHQSKMRIAYDYKNTEIVIDKWPFLEPYVEIEGKNKSDILEVVHDLGFAEEDALVINTDDLYLEKGIDVYSEKYNDLVFNKVEQQEVSKYMND